MELAIALLDMKVVYARQAALHKAVARELPVLVPVGTKPVFGIVAPSVAEPHGDPVALECPEFLDQVIVKFLCPFARQKRDDPGPAMDELRPVPPIAVGGVGQRHPFWVAGIPTVFGASNLALSGFSREGRKGRVIFCHIDLV
jgi:hypothetical protein